MSVKDVGFAHIGIQGRLPNKAAARIKGGGCPKRDRQLPSGGQGPAGNTKGGEARETRPRRRSRRGSGFVSPDVTGDSQPRTPMALAVLLCDEVLKSATGKNSLIGVFDKINCPGFPAQHQSLWVYAKLADGAGKYSVRIKYVDVEGNKTLLNIVAPLAIDWKQGNTFDVSIRQVGLPMPHAGRYEFQIFLNDNFVGMAAFEAVLQVKQPPQPPQRQPHS